jgi:hypothetical protein
MSIRDICENRALQTMSRAILILGPKVTDRYALEEQKEEVHGAEDHNNCEGGVNNNSLISFA